MTVVKFLGGPCDGMESDMDASTHNDQLTYGVPAGMAPGCSYMEPHDADKHMHIYTSHTLGGVGVGFFEVISVYYDGMFPVEIMDEYGACDIKRENGKG